MSNVEVMPGIERTDLPAEAQPQDDIIEFLRKLLDQAQRGEIQAIAACFVRPGYATGYGTFASRGGLCDQILSAAIADMFTQTYSDRAKLTRDDAAS